MSVDVREDERVQTYLRHVCGQVKAAEMHRDIRLELESHIQELVDDKMDGGQPSGQAVEETLIELGNPLAIGKGLHQVHKPKMEWGLLAIVFMFLTMALFAVFAVGTSMQQSRLGFGADFFKREMVFVALGLGVMLSLYFMDYRKIERWAWAVLASPLLLVLLAHLDGSKVNGQIWLNVGSFGFDVASVSVCCFVLGGAAIYSQERWLEVPMWLRLAIFVVLPSFLFIHLHSLSSMVLYVASYMAIQIVAKTRRLELGLGMTIWFVLGIAYVLRSPFNAARLTAFLHPDVDRNNLNYMVWNSIQSIRSAGWWGQGFAAVNNNLPNIHSEMMFSYLIYSQGWIAGIVIVLSCALLVSRLIQTGLKIKDTFGRAIVLGFTAVIGVQFAWSFAMSVGWLPISGFQMPFLSYGGSQLMLTCACIGCILSVYRKKDRISNAPSSAYARK